MSIPVAPTHPPQRSFKPRRRALSPARAAAYERAMVSWGLDAQGGQLSFGGLFVTASGLPPDVILDIGFGGGEAVIELAELRPHEQIIAVDVHTPGVAAVLEAISSRGLCNLRVVHGDALELIERIPPRSLAAIRVFFPDPWPKHRQRNRRLIRGAVVDRLVALLRGGGSLHLATDSGDYAQQMRRVCDAAAGLQGGIVERPSWRPVTRFEQRGIDEGRPCVDLLYIASESSPNDSSSA